MSFELRPGEVIADHLPAGQVGLIIIGLSLTPWTQRLDCSRQGPLLDLKPERRSSRPLAPLTPGDGEAE